MVWLSCAGFMALVAYVSYRLTRGTVSSSTGFFLAGRSLTGTFIAGSLLLTNISAEQIIGLAGSAYAFNLSSMAWEVVAVVAIMIMALVFLLSPVQNPWYLCWVVPFLCIFPHRAWIILTGLVGFYYLDFYFDYQELQVFSLWIPWVEYSPFYFLLALQFWESRKKIQLAEPFGNRD